MKFYLKTPEEIESELKSSANGITTDEAVKRLEKYGANKLKSAKKVSLFSRFFSEIFLKLINLISKKYFSQQW